MILIKYKIYEKILFYMITTHAKRKLEKCKML